MPSPRPFTSSPRAATRQPQPPANTARRVVRRTVHRPSALLPPSSEVVEQGTASTNSHTTEAVAAPTVSGDTTPRHSLSSPSRVAAAPSGVPPPLPSKEQSNVPHAEMKETVGTETPPRLRLDRTVFSSSAFTASTFVNNLTHQMVYPALLQLHHERNGRADTRAGELYRNLSEPDRQSSPIRGSDGGALFSSSHLPVSARKTEDAKVGQIDHHALAGMLSRTLAEAAAEVDALLAKEEANLRLQEAQCRRVEIREKRQLAAVRLGLEATTGRLQEYENCLNNAKTATAGIEQHLFQSSARVQRGKMVSQLLRYFGMFTSIQPVELSSVLKNLSKARVDQRSAVTEGWAINGVSAFNPRFYNPPAAAADAAVDSNLGGESSGPRSARMVRRRRSGSQMGARMASSESATAGEAAMGDVSGLGEAGERDTRSITGAGGDDDDDDDDDTPYTKVRLHRFEVAAVAAGLHRLFVLRGNTPGQVEWIQKLSLLAHEVGTYTSHTANIETYATWLRQELVSDLFHLISCFNVFYDQHRQTAVHQTYARATLKSLGQVSRLYATITPSTDSLLKVFFTHSVNELGVTLVSEYAPQPLPSQPPLSTPAQPNAMSHFMENIEPDLKRTFQFLVDRAKRDVVVVETIFGVSSTARQQLLGKVMDGVVRLFVTQQMKLAETHAHEMLTGESRLSPRSKRKGAPRVADAIAFYHTMQARLLVHFQNYIAELSKAFDETEVNFLHRYTDIIFGRREAYSTTRAELDLLRRYYVIIEERYTRSLHPLPDEFFDLREAHMAKSKELLDRLVDVVTRVRVYARPQDVGPYVGELIQEALRYVGSYLDAELLKTCESIRLDRDNWRLRPKSEEALLKPSRPESQQCGLRMLLYTQSTLLLFSERITSLYSPLLQTFPRLEQDVEDAKSEALRSLDERAEHLLNLCAQAIITRSLAILVHYQGKGDYLPKETRSGAHDAIAPPCTRACTLFCYYVTRQFEEASKFIHLSNGQVPLRNTTVEGAHGFLPTARPIINAGTGTAVLAHAMPNADNTSTGRPMDSSHHDAVRSRARTMNLQQLLYGDGGPSSFVRTVGVCLYRGITTHLKTLSVNHRGAFIYKQDVTAYKEAMGPLTSTPGLGGAVVEVLFSLLKDTSNLLIMPVGYIKEVMRSGTLKLLSSEEVMRFLRIRKDMSEVIRAMDQS